MLQCVTGRVTWTCKLGFRQYRRGLTMARATKRQRAIPTALSKELTEWALREGKSVQAFLRNLLAEHKRHRLTVEFKELQNYWSKKAKANELKTLRSLKGVLKGMSTENIREKPPSKELRIARSRTKSRGPVDADTLLANARALRRTSKNVRVTDRLLHSLKGTHRSMTKTNVRRKQKSA